MDDTRTRNRLGAVTFVMVVIGAVLAIFPATAPLGMLLCLVAVVPAIIAMLRVRRGTQDARRRSVVALVVAPVFFVVALATMPPQTVTTASTVPAPAAPQAAVAAPAAVAPAAVAPAAIAPPASLAAVAPPAAPAPVARAAAPLALVAEPAAPKAAAAAAPEPAPKPAPAPAPKPAPAKPALVKAAPVKPAPVKAAPVKTAPSASCPQSDHYVNSSGACVLRPVHAAVAPAGATAQCKDGTYSFSQTHSGTCSRHGGVSRWL